MKSDERKKLLKKANKLIDPLQLIENQPFNQISTKKK